LDSTKVFTITPVRFSLSEGIAKQLQGGEAVGLPMQLDQVEQLSLHIDDGVRRSPGQLQTDRRAQASAPLQAVIEGR
jgi:hypothetical protein